MLTDFLRHTEDRGFPEEYLIARIAGRKASSISDWNRFIYSDNPLEDLRSTVYREFIDEYMAKGVWKRMMKELKWVYLNMNNDLREKFTPFFVYMEMKNLMLCLRYRFSGSDISKIREVIHYSLLSHKITALLKGTLQLPYILRELEKREIIPLNRVKGIRAVFSEKGLSGLEQSLTSVILEEIMNTRLNASLKIFFTLTADSKNLVTAWKHIRWSITTAPVFIMKGGINPVSLEKAVESRDMTRIHKIIYSVTGHSVEEHDTAGVETLFSRHLTKRLKECSRKTGAGFILYYLWQCCTEARNLSTILYGKGLRRDTVREEISV